MNNILTNQLNTVAACINIAESALFKPVWDGQSPADFGADLALLKTGYGETIGIAALAGATITGGADAKDIAETLLEDLGFQLCRALANHHKKTGNLIDRAKVDIRIGVLQKLRDQALVTKSIEIRDLATVAKDETGASGRGITAARIAAYAAAITNFDALRTQPRGQIVNRSTYLRDLTTRIAALMEALHDLDDLVLQMDTTEAGRLFISAWNQARIILDAGHGPKPEPATPATPSPSAPTV